MKYLLALAILITPAAYAAPVKALFGTQRFTPNSNHTVTGPLVQLQSVGGATLSFQQGARFNIADDGTITLTSGNLRVGPVGDQPFRLNLPQGHVVVEPLTALTVTADNKISSGRIYHGNLQTEDRTFTTGQGFALTPSGARGTFTPAPAQAPALTEDYTHIEPAAGPSQPTRNPTESTKPLTTGQRTPTTPQMPAQPDPITPAQPQPEQPPLPTNPNPILTPEPETPVDPSQPEPPTDEPETPTIEQPGPAITPEPEAPVIPTQPETPIPPTVEPEQPTVPQPEPETSLPPTPITRNGLIASFSQQVDNLSMPDNIQATPSAFQLDEYADGTQALTQTSTKRLATNLITLNQGTALNLDATSNGATAGIGRWVGGELTAVRSGIPTAIANSTQVAQPDGTILTSPNSLHYIWGEKPTNVPTSGRIEYSLFSATQPTYFGATTQTSDGATFNGSLAIDFAPQSNNIAGVYHFNGTVTMPQSAQTEAGTTTTPVTYTLSTPTNGNLLSGKSFLAGALNVTAPEGALACPSGCTGTITTSGFGAEMNTVGSLYTVNPDGAVGINGAAIFTANPH